MRTWPPSRLHAAAIVLEAQMRAACYETQGPAQQILQVGTMPSDSRSARSADSDFSVRHQSRGHQETQNAFGYGMAFPRVVPHSDDAGTIDLVGEGVSADVSGSGDESP